MAQINGRNRKAPECGGDKKTPGDRVRDLEAAILYACDDSRSFVSGDCVMMSLSGFERLMEAVKQ